MDEFDQENMRIEKIGKLLSTIVLVLLLVIFVYGYSEKFIAG